LLVLLASGCDQPPRTFGDLERQRIAKSPVGLWQPIGVRIDDGVASSYIVNTKDGRVCEVALYVLEGKRQVSDHCSSPMPE